MVTASLGIGEDDDTPIIEDVVQEIHHVNQLVFGGNEQIKLTQCGHCTVFGIHFLRNRYGTGMS